MFRIQLYITLSILICDIGFSFGQNWPKIYGHNVLAYVNNIHESYDKGYLIGGSILSDPNTFKYAWIIKTDINGTVLWDKKLGNGTNQYYLNNCKLTSDHGIIIGGATTKYDAELDPMVIKLDSCYNVEWCTVLSSEGYNVAEDVIQSTDNQYIAILRYYAGYNHNQRISLVKIDTEGNPVWIKNCTWDDTLMTNEEGLHLLLTADGNYLVSGECTHPGMRPFWFMTDSTGEQSWDLVWGNHTGWTFQTIEKDTGIFYCAGTYGNQTCLHPSIFKFNENGLLLNQYYMLGDTIVAGGASSIAKYDDSTLIVGIAWTNVPFPVGAGYTDVVTTDTTGNILKIRLLLDDPQGTQDITTTFDKKILVTGAFYVNGHLDIYLWKLNSDLELDTLYTQPFTYDSLCPGTITSDTVDLSCGLYVSIKDIPLKEDYDKVLKVYPNPAISAINFEFKDLKTAAILSIYDTYGRLIEEKAVPAHTKDIQIAVLAYRPGLYLAVLKNAEGILGREKIMVER